MWKQLEMSLGLESDLRDTVEWNSRWLDHSASSNVVSIKMSEAALEDKSLFQLLHLSFIFLNYIRESYIAFKLPRLLLRLLCALESFLHLS